MRDAGAVARAMDRAGATREQWCFGLLALAVVTYVVTFCALTFSLYDRFGMMAFDFGIFHQAVWLIAHGETPFSTLRGNHLLGDHFSVILYPVALVYAVAPHPKTLLALQTVALALGALPVFGLARRAGLAPAFALLFAVAYLLYPPLQWSNVYEFHPDTFATPLLLAALFCLEAGRWRGYALALLLVALTKESAGVTLVGVGLLALRRDRRAGWATVAGGVAALAVALAVVRHFNGGEPSPYWWLYSRWGETPGEIARNLLTRPHLPLLSVAGEWRYFWLLLAPLCLLPLAGAERLLPAVPVVLSNLLTSRPFMHGIEEHYTAFLTPFVFAAAVTGCTRLDRFATARAGGMAGPVRLTLAVNLALWGVGMAAVGPLAHDPTTVHGGLPEAVARDVRQTLSVIPAGASVSAQFALGSRLSGRARVYLLPNPFVPVAYGGGVSALRQVDAINGTPLPPPATVATALDAAPVEYVALSPLTFAYPLSQADHAHFAVAALRSRRYGVVRVGVACLVLRRGADRAVGLRLLADAAGQAIRGDDDLESAYWRWMARQSHAIADAIRKEKTP